MKVYNTLTRKLERFKPITAGKVGLYTCGPTVYDYAHIGNLRTYIFEDILRKTLEMLQFKVNHVMNITDVGHLTSDADTGEDKMEKSARKKKMSAYEVAEKFTKAFLHDIARLNIAQAHTLCKATEHIQEQIAMIKAIEAKGATYITDDGVYFDTSCFANYGKMAKLDVQGLQAGQRIDMKNKKHKTDFALWKFSPKGEKREMEWDSPWGVGFPGWHIECSAMSVKYLGDQFDIHTGGTDHIPVHHTNEIAQTETATGKSPWVKYWLHGEFLVLDEGRMGKSLGNFITLQTLVDKGFDPLAYRYLCLQTHYRKHLQFSMDALQGAANTYARLKEIVCALPKREAKLNSKYVEDFITALEEDLNTPKALAVLWAVLRDKSLKPEEKYALLVEFDNVLGLGISTIHPDIPETIAKLVQEREHARSYNDFAKADMLRKKISDMGYVVDDSPNGPIVKKRA